MQTSKHNKRLLKRLYLGPIVCLVLGAIAGSASGQAAWNVESLIPEVLSIRAPSTTIAFAIDNTNYPPAEFPAIYPATEPTGGVLPVQVFSNAEGLWSLMLEIPDLVSPTGTTLLAASQVLYRVNGGVWLRADGSPQVIYSQFGQTTGWFELRIEFALELTGEESAGSYLVSALVSAIRESGF